MPPLLQPRTPPPLSVLTPSILRRPPTASLLPSSSFFCRRFPSQKRRRSCSMSVNDGSQSQSHPPSPSTTKLTGNELRNSLRFSRAFWVNESLIAWNVDLGDRSCFLYASKSASLETVNNSIQGYEVKIKLERSGGALPDDVIKKFPHIQGYEAYRLPPASDVRSLLKCQLAVGIIESNGTCCNATSLQLPGVLDDLFAYTGPLGAVFSSDHISLYLWAPTAQAVRALLFSHPTSGDPLEILELEEIDKVWTAKGPRHWEGYYYEYEVSVYHPTTLRVEKCFASDPYSCGLSSNARRTLLVNLTSESLKPEGWERLAGMKPQIVSFSDISIYELHIRDFSANDETVPPDLRGGYEAFTLQDSAGMRHLKKLSDSGLTHIHLLPAFQFAGVDDEKANWKSIDFRKLEQLPPDSVEQQTQITAIQDEDGYNWGYNPVIWGVPKGSYASDPNGPCRIIEFRKMIQVLNCIGLRVIMDVVYNHLNASGPCDDSSVLDKIVPGYYLRRNSDGLIEHSACANNTASEHFMVERLIIDDLLRWAVDYKVDGFRFDLMGHLMKHTMTRAKVVLSSLSKEADGVDGSSIYIYGEGWDFGEVAKNSRGINACQFNLGGTGIGSFNDRIRDAVLGGSPFGHPLQQGFVTGLFLQPNAYDYGGADEKLMLAISKDHIQVGMAANLGEYVFVDHEGLVVKGSEVLTYDQTPVAYAICPTEIGWTTPVMMGEIQSPYDYFSLMDCTIKSRLAAESMRPSLIDSAKKKCAEINSLIMESNLDDCCDKLPKIIKVNYVSAHDNETLFDVISMKTPMEVSVDARCRLNHLATSLIGLSQGVPFFHCGDELLRSKSLDRDSYNSGDWFNRLDFNFNTNNWGVGLPPREENKRNWPLIQPRLADPSFKPQKSNILAAVDNFLNLLRIRYSSPLFRLRTANAIQERVHFINTGPSAVPGLIVMSIEDGHEGVPGLTQLDPVYSFLVVLINARPTETEFASTSLKAKTLKLHPVQLMSSDETVKSSAYDAASGCFTIPARTTSVFVEPRS